jgi:glycerophosphoryl diester phosphodiesterase
MSAPPRRTRPGPFSEPSEHERGADYTDPLSADTMASSKIDRQIWPAVVAHRGASSTHPENTMVSFLAAVEAGADFVELDVRLTADDVPVVLHDFDVSRTTGGTGLVHQMTLSEVKALDASGGRGTWAEIPTFEEVLRGLSGRVGVDVEIKNLPGEPAFDSPVEAIAEHVVRLIEETRFDGPVIMSSFNWLPIERIRELAPEIPTGFITSALIDPWAALVYVRSRGHDLLVPQAPALYEAGPEFVQAAHEAGVRLAAWTVDDPDAVERLFTMGVDAVATNDPGMAVPVRDRYRQSPAQ